MAAAVLLAVVAALVAVAAAAPSPAGTAGRIVGGSPAAGPSAYPFFARLSTRNGSESCGGTLVRDRVVLTAAHCAVAAPAAQWTAEVRRFNLSRAALADGAAEHPVLRVLVHPGFRTSWDGSLENDIALMFLGPPVARGGPTPAPAIVRLNRDPTAPVLPRMGRSLGFGSLRQDGPLSTILNQVDLLIVPRENCVPAMGDAYGLPTILCAGMRNKDTCFGDSGGPLLVPWSQGGWLQVGIVSFGKGCAMAPYGAYTRVSSFAAWIEQAAGPVRTTRGPIVRTTSIRRTTTRRLTTTRPPQMTEVCRTVNKWIPDAGKGSLDDTLTVSGTGVARALGVRMRLNHTYLEDLTASVSRFFDGVTLFQRATCDASSPAGRDLVFDDSATLRLGAGQFRSCDGTVFAPYASLSGNVGQNADGDWTLTIRDGGGGDVGYLFSWCMRITYMK